MTAGDVRKWMALRLVAVLLPETCVCHHIYTCQEVVPRKQSGVLLS